MNREIFEAFHAALLDAGMIKNEDKGACDLLTWADERRALPELSQITANMYGGKPVTKLLPIEIATVRALLRRKIEISGVRSMAA